MEGGEFALIDFENSGYAPVEKDTAYFYMEAIYFNPKLAEEIRLWTKEYQDYSLFLYYSLVYCLSSLENPFSNKRGLESMVVEIKEEINRIL